MSETTIMEYLYDWFEQGDPLIRHWFLVSSFKGPLFITTFYVLFVKVIGPAIMKNRPAMEFNTLLPIYNFGLVIFYVVFLLRGCLLILTVGLRLFCGTFDAATEPEICGLIWQLYMIKYVELIDTVFLVLRKKFHMITFLHTFHHFFVPLYSFAFLRCEKSTYISFFMGVNSFVHIIMYAYYGFAALGPKFQKYLWWKRYLTLLQIMQFQIIAIYMTIMGLVGCMKSKFLIWFSFGVAILFMWLFWEFYKTSFGFKTAKQQISHGRSDKMAKESTPQNIDKSNEEESNSFCEHNSNDCKDNSTKSKSVSNSECDGCMDQLGQAVRQRFTDESPRSNHDEELTKWKKS